jgi:YegS/Rv2252/BmrU family lipid kinase
VVAGYAVGAFWVCAGALVFHPAPRSRPVEAFSTPVPTSRQLSVVLNPSKFEDVPTFKAMVEHSAAQSGWGTPSWRYTTIEDTGRSMAEAAAIEGAEMVLVAGGDGTVRTVCAELAGTGVSVGVVPAGTGNLLARNLGIPLFLQAAVDVALNGQDRAIDMVKVSGDGLGDDEHFMVMAGMGFDAAIMEGANEQIKAKVGWLAYVVSALRNLMFPAMRLEVCVDDGEWTRHRARTVVIGNVGYLQGGMPLLPDASIDDGLLDAVLLHPRRFLSWIPLAVRVLSRGTRTDELVNRMRGTTISVRCSSDAPRQLDGDPIGAGRLLRAECVHGRLLVRVPR